MNLLTVGVLLALSAQPANAQSYGTYGCTGDCTTPNDLTVNKQVYNPITKVYVENLGPTDTTFAAGETVEFKLKVTNGSGETMDVTLEDTLPPHMIWLGGDGNYDANTNKVTVKLGQMTAGSTIEVKVLAKVKDIKDLPAGKSVFCEINTAKVTSPARPAGDDDTAQACIATDILAAKTLPTAGFNDIAMVVPFAATALAGLTLIRKRK